ARGARLARHRTGAVGVHREADRPVGGDVPRGGGGGGVIHEGQGDGRADGRVGAQRRAVRSGGAGAVVGRRGVDRAGQVQRAAGADACGGGVVDDRDGEGAAHARTVLGGA